MKMAMRTKQMQRHFDAGVDHGMEHGADLVLAHLRTPCHDPECSIATELKELLPRWNTSANTPADSTEKDTLIEIMLDVTAALTEAQTTDEFKILLRRIVSNICQTLEKYVPKVKPSKTK